jgi:hypothetical protein
VATEETEPTECHAAGPRQCVAADEPAQAMEPSPRNAVLSGRCWTPMTATRLMILSIAVWSVGCLSEQPVLPGSPESVDRSLLGSWRCVFPRDEDASTLTITETGDRGIRAVFSGSDPEGSGWVAYAVKFDGKRLLNIRADGDESRKWTLARYALYQPTVLHVEYPKYDNATFMQATTPAERRGALRRGYKAKSLFDDSFTCVRIVEEASQK